MMARAAGKEWYLNVRNGVHSGIYGPVEDETTARIVLDVLRQMGMDADAQQVIVPSGEDLLPIRSLNLAYFAGPLPRPERKPDWNDDEDDD